MFKAAVAFLALALLSAARSDARDPLASATVVLFNSKDPDSAALAAHYARARSIPKDQVFGLELPLTEEISRTEFDSHLAGPLRDKFLASGWWILRNAPDSGNEVARSRIRFLAIIRGVPLKIRSDSSIGPAPETNGFPRVIAARNEASVDSELAAMGLAGFSPAGLVPNPYFGRFTPILDESVPPGILLPSRLDGPTPAIVREMIDASVATESEGLWGWGYVDGRDITTGGYTEGDNWMRNLVKILRERGVPTIFQNLPATFEEDFPVTDAAVYFGWYAGDVNGPFASPDFRFRRGAVAVHLHSFSAETLRSDSRHWCGPLLARGAAATLGNVHEPYLSLTANLDIFQDRLMTGLSLAEAGWMSQRALSWMGVVVGDPLYRPYVAWNNFFDPRNRPPNPWRKFRSITLAARSNILNAVLPLHDAASETGDSMFLEALGNAQLDAGHPAAAYESLRAALRFAKVPAVKTRLDAEIAQTAGLIPAKAPAGSAKPPGPKPEDFLPPEMEIAPPHFKPTPEPTPEWLPNLPYPDP